jgi:copper chaperone CopZ
MPNVLSFRVIGTKCASCEIVLERELKLIPGVLRVGASHEGGRVDLTVEDGAVVGVGDLEARVGMHGYRFEPAEEASQAARSWKHVGAAAIIVFGLYMLLKETGALAFSPTVEGSTSLGTVFIIGLVAAFSSCTAVVAGLVVAVSSTAAKSHVNAAFSQKLRPHALFNAGRAAGFAGFGALTGLAGSVLSLSATANAWLILVIAALMIALGVNLLDVLPGGFAIRPPMSWSRRIVALAESKHPGVPFLLGALTYFLPCGFTQSMQL